MVSHSMNHCTNTLKRAVEGGGSRQRKRAMCSSNGSLVHAPHVTCHRCLAMIGSGLRATYVTCHLCLVMCSYVRLGLGATYVTCHLRLVMFGYVRLGLSVCGAAHHWHLRQQHTMPASVGDSYRPTYGRCVGKHFGRFTKRSVRRWKQTHIREMHGSIRSAR